MAEDKSSLSVSRRLVPAERKRRDLLELFIAYGLVLLTLWTPQPWQRLFYLTALAWVACATWVSFDGWSAMGLRIPGSLRAFWVVGVALLLAALAAGLAGRFRTLQLPGDPAMFVKRYWSYAIWAFLQEFLLLDFVLLRLLRLLPGTKTAAIAAASLFALAHLPNPILAPATLVWGLVACLIFVQYRNVHTLAIAHAIFGICIAVTVPSRVDHHMRVGLGYLTYRAHDHHHRSQKDHIVSTQAWVIAEAPTRRS